MKYYPPHCISVSWAELLTLITFAIFTMNKKRHKNELEVDFIGGEELTEKEETLLKDYFSKKKKQRRKTIPTRKNKDREKVK